jgi:hypothetical protein
MIALLALLAIAGYQNRDKATNLAKDAEAPDQERDFASEPSNGT